MQYTKYYNSPIGKILISCDDLGLTGLWFDGQIYFAENLLSEHAQKAEKVEKTEKAEKDHAILTETVKWLDIYFSGNNPDFTPKLHMTGTDFRLKIWNILIKIPYGKTMTYGEVAKRAENLYNLKKVSARSIGGAVAHNNIAIIVPCHRVIGADGSLTGYSAGIDRKAALLKLEGVIL